MPPLKPLKNYIRSARLRAGLTQDELAYLIGGHGGKLVSRYELFKREPSLQMALVCQVVFNEPVHELFSGIYHIARETAQRRARVMALQLKQKPDSKSVRLKRKTMDRILGADTDSVTSETP